MAKSKAKKLRDKMMREGKRNPELNRGMFVFADMQTRTTKTKQEKLNKQRTKHKKRLSDDRYTAEDNRFYFALLKTTGLKEGP
ncbi:hypothetical protein FZC66_08415 [Priestia megaterium]|nr:hypothetical protein FZC66_08415 [Priestia megaterium]